jgi:hypothetical protein
MTEMRDKRNYPNVNVADALYGKQHRKVGAGWDCGCLWWL